MSSFILIGFVLLVYPLIRVDVYGTLILFSQSQGVPLFLGVSSINLLGIIVFIKINVNRMIDISFIF